MAAINPKTTTARASKFAAKLFEAFTGGQTGKGLADRFTVMAPALIIEGEEGYSARAWGIESPPYRTKTQAIMTWAKMAEDLQLTVDSEALSERIQTHAQTIGVEKPKALICQGAVS